VAKQTSNAMMCSQALPRVMRKLAQISSRNSETICVHNWIVMIFACQVPGEKTGATPVLARLRRPD